MPKKLQKSLQDCLSKLKNHPTPNTHFSTSKKWILSGCKHPKTLSFAIDRNQNLCHDEDVEIKHGDSATLSDVDRFLFENFRSLYINDNDENDDKTKKDDEQEGIFSSPSRFIDPPHDLCGSDRFFMAPGRSSGSLIEETRASLTASSEDIGSSTTNKSTSTNEECTNDHDLTDKISLPEDTIAVLKYSQGPYEDFRRSMQEMVEARLRYAGKLDWDFMEEILFCYLNLNNKRLHKFILNAFVDLVVGLRRNSDRIPARSRSSSRVARGRRRKLRHM